MSLLEPKKVCIIDGDIICYKIASNKKQTEEQKEQQGLQEDRTWDQVKSEVDDYIQALMLKVDSDKYILALSVGKCFRYDIYPEYKANRKNLERPKYLDKIKEYMITDYKAVHHAGLEADDIITICAESYKGSIIATIDKDLKQKEGIHFNLDKNTFDTVDEFTAAYNLYFQCLVGDSTDNIKGCPKIGKVKAEEALSKANKEIHMLKHIALTLYCRTLGDHEGIKQFYLNYSLVKLLDKPEFNFQIPEPMKYELNIAL